MAKAEVSLIVNRQAHDVFAYLTDIDKETEWQTELIEAKQTSAGPISVGTTVREVRRFMGRRMEVVFQITEFEPNEKMAFQSTSGPFPMHGQYTLQPVDGGTKVTFFIEGELSGVFKMAEPIVAHTAKRQMDADLARLKTILESSEG